MTWQTNQTLAEQYFSVVASGNYRNDSTYRTYRTKIANTGPDISAFFEEHGSLEGLGVTGIGGKTKRVLELILGEGVEAAQQTIYGERVDEIRASAFSGIPTEPYDEPFDPNGESAQDDYLEN
ncbi:hypothetical protein CMO88_03425 [Candidatus Woesearchaeota archaeon]|nr:hypothetical protein [Candidatus Woesearchaeota archaeon]|tara:strand:+ start:21178 stop:21546 length:369 start_codon:yes stop_codon:yes gene_type:complete